jgi:hypothetical protein
VFGDDGTVIMRGSGATRPTPTGNTPVDRHRRGGDDRRGPQHLLVPRPDEVKTERTDDRRRRVTAGPEPLNRELSLVANVS